MKRSPLLSQHEAAEARLAPAGDSLTLLTYGAVPDEYEAARHGCGLFDQTERSCLSVTGPEAAGFLQRITANDVEGLAAGVGCHNLLLTGKGKVLEDFDVLPQDGGYLLSLAPGRAEGLRDKLDMYLFADQVEMEICTEKHAPVAVCGAQAAEVIHKVLGIQAPTEYLAQGAFEFGGERGVCVHVGVAGSPGWRIDVGPAQVAALWSALTAAGARPAGLIVEDMLRVEAGRARFGTDIDDSMYPQEARLEAAFSLTKGCYVGQEIVAKIDTYGGLNKRLVALQINHDDPVAAGTRLMREQDGEWRDLGVVTSWAYSFELDTGLVLGYVKRKHQLPGTAFRLGEAAGSEAVITALPVRSDALPISPEVEAG